MSFRAGTVRSVAGDPTRDVEPPRLLHRRLGYTTSIREALPHEPEAVSAETQAELTARALRTVNARKRQAWLESRGRLERELEQLRWCFGSAIADELRGIRRAIDRLEQKLAL
jgi:hypothetical protein